MFSDVYYLLLFKKCASTFSNAAFKLWLCNALKWKMESSNIKAFFHPISNRKIFEKNDKHDKL